MSGHVTDKIGDILAGRLSPEEHAAAEVHMKACDDCALEIAWTRRFREQALRQGVRHLHALRIIELAGSPNAATAAERDHLSSCADCGGELHWIEGLPADGEAGETEAEEDAETQLESAPGRRGAMLRRVWLPIGLAAAAILLVVLLPRLGEPDLSGLTVLEPIPVRINRAVPEPESFEDYRQQGLEAYLDGDYTTATEHLDAAVNLRPGDPSMHLYLGSSYLLLKEPARARESLVVAMENARDPALKDEAAWQLANALLLAGRTGEAEESLEALAVREGRRQQEARALLESVGAAR